MHQHGETQRLTRVFTVLKIVKAEEKILTDTEVSLILYKIVNADLARAMKTIKPCKKKKHKKKLKKIL